MALASRSRCSDQGHQGLPDALQSAIDPVWPDGEILSDADDLDAQLCNRVAIFLRRYTLGHRKRIVE